MCNWSNIFKKLTDDLDLAAFWNNDNFIPMVLAKNRLWDRFKANWEHHFTTKPKLRTYMKHKNDISVASHISCNLPKYERSLISQLRLGILTLRIETGRYCNLSVENRICLLCDSGHFE